MKKLYSLLSMILFLTACAPGQQDLFSAAGQAQHEADVLHAALTGTAEAPMIQLTSQSGQITQAAAWAQATNESGHVTQTASVIQTQAAYTPTLVPTPTLIPSPTPNSTAILGAAQVRAQLTSIALNLESKENTQDFYSSITPFLILISLLAIAFVGIQISRGRRYQPQKRDEMGKTIPLFDSVEGVYEDLDVNPNGVTAKDTGIMTQLAIHMLEKKFKGFQYQPAQPPLTAERVDVSKEREQVIQVQRIIHARLPKPLTDVQSMKFLDDVKEDTDLQQPEDWSKALNLPLPPWEFFDRWQGRNRPLGFGLHGLITTEGGSPHFLTSGKTRMGKTSMLRTQTTASLTQGYQVINLGFSNSGFGVFADHPNYISVELQKASDIIDCLASVYRELKERKEILGGASHSWATWPGGTPPSPFIDLLVDELGNLAEDIYTFEETQRDGATRTRELWRYMSLIASEGAKFGIQFTAALQDPTAKSVDLRFRRNCTLVAFQLSDASQSSAFLGTTGATLLQVGHFMARIGDLVVGGGFDPTDDDIRTYLGRHTAQPTPPPLWMDGVIIEPKQIETPTQATLTDTNALHVDEARRLAEEEIKILELHARPMSVSAIVRTMWGVGGGGQYAPLAERVKAVIKHNSTSASSVAPTNDLPMAA